MTKSGGQERLIFLHIPKTGGTSLTATFRDSVGKAGVWQVDAPQLPQSLAHFRSAPAAELMAIRVLSGHFPIGLDRYLPGPSFYATILRQPVDRVLSDYYYCQRAESHPLHAAIKAGDLPLERFIETCPNAMTLRLCDFNLERHPTAWREQNLGLEPAARFAMAAKNLSERIAVVGLYEALENSLALIAGRMGWPRRPIARRNVTADRPKVSEHPPALLRRIEALNEWDSALYDLARRRFRWALADQRRRVVA